MKPPLRKSVIPTHQYVKELQEMGVGVMFGKRDSNMQKGDSA